MKSGNREITKGTIDTRRALTGLIREEIKVTQFEKSPQINKMNTLAGITEMVISVDELDNAINLQDARQDGTPSDTLFTYHVTAYKDFTHFIPYTPQYKKHKNGEFVSLALRIMHKKNNIITDSLATTVGLHIR